MKCSSASRRTDMCSRYAVPARDAPFARMLILPDPHTCSVLIVAILCSVHRPQSCNVAQSIVDFCTIPADLRPGWLLCASTH